MTMGKLKQEVRNPIDFTVAKLFIESIPPGRWAAYLDVAAAASGSKLGAVAIGNRLKNSGSTEFPNCWRVLLNNGSVSPEWQVDSENREDVPSTPFAVVKRLSNEGVTFDDNFCASETQRWGLEAFSVVVSRLIAERAVRDATAEPFTRQHVADPTCNSEGDSR